MIFLEGWTEGRTEWMECTIFKSRQVINSIAWLCIKYSEKSGGAALPLLLPSSPSIWTFCFYSVIVSFGSKLIHNELRHRPFGCSVSILVTSSVSDHIRSREDDCDR